MGKKLERSEKEIIALHETLPLRKADFGEHNRCDSCKRIAGTVWLGSEILPDVPSAAGKVLCLECISHTQASPAQFMTDTLRDMHPVARQMATIYEDQFKEDELV